MGSFEERLLELLHVFLDSVVGFEEKAFDTYPSF